MPLPRMSNYSMLCFGLKAFTSELCDANIRKRIASKPRRLVHHKMSNVEYNSLLFQISRRLGELNEYEQLVFMCRDLLPSGSEDNQDVLSLFRKLEERDHLGSDRLGVMRDLLKGLKEWDLLGKVKKFESKRKEYVGLVEQIIRVLDELNDLERLITMCRGRIPEDIEGNISDVRSLFKELENRNCLGIDCLGIVKEILIEFEKEDLLKEVEEFEKRRFEDEEFESRKGTFSVDHKTALN